MLMWVVRVDDHADVAWSGCEVVDALLVALGPYRYLVQATEAAIAAVRAQPGVVSAVRASAGRFDADGGRIYWVGADDTGYSHSR